MTDQAWRRLVHYCRRARFTPPEFVELEYDNGIRRYVRFVGPDLRAIVWADAEVRNALLALAAGEDDEEHWTDAEWDGRMSRWKAFDAELERQGGSNCGLIVLDLVSAMGLEAERHETRTDGAGRR